MKKIGRFFGKTFGRTKEIQYGLTDIIESDARVVSRFIKHNAGGSRFGIDAPEDHMVLFEIGDKTVSCNSLSAYRDLDVGEELSLKYRFGVDETHDYTLKNLESKSVVKSELTDSMYLESFERK